MKMLTRIRSRGVLTLTALAVALALVPASASATGARAAWGGSPWGSAPQSYGATSLTPDAATIGALTSLGVSVGVVAPASSGPNGIGFPITNSLVSALYSGTIVHSGGLTLTGSGKEVSLTNYIVSIGSRQLSADVSAGPAGGTLSSLGRLAILNLNFSGAHLSFFPTVTLGPLVATLTSGAAADLNGVFGTNALSSSTVLGSLTVRYSRL
jgi:hypothetical protein